MKGLGMEPTKDVLAIVLMFWHEECAKEPPRKGKGKGRWLTLVDWMAEWVGDEALPATEDLKKWRVIADGMKFG